MESFFLISQYPSTLQPVHFFLKKNKINSEHPWSRWKNRQIQMFSEKLLPVGY